MTPSGTVTIPPSLLKLLTTHVVGTLGMLVGILGISFALLGFGNFTLVACAVVVGLSVVLFLLGLVRQRPRVLITPEGFVFERLFGGQGHKWGEIDGPFAVAKIGRQTCVAYKLTPEYKSRVGTKPTTLFAGYDGVIGGALSCPPEELARLLNDHKQRAGVSH